MSCKSSNPDSSALTRTAIDMNRLGDTLRERTRHVNMRSKTWQTQTTKAMLYQCCVENSIFGWIRLTRAYPVIYDSQLNSRLYWQRNGERCSFANSAFDYDFATMCVYYALANCQTKTHSFRLSSC